MLSLTACQRRNNASESYTESQRLQLDTSAIRSKNIDSLTALVNRYKKSEERDKEMAAYAELGHCFLNANPLHQCDSGTPAAARNRHRTRRHADEG